MEEKGIHGEPAAVDAAVWPPEARLDGEHAGKAMEVEDDEEEGEGRSIWGGERLGFVEEEEVILYI